MFAESAIASSYVRSLLTKSGPATVLGHKRGRYLYLGLDNKRRVLALETDDGLSLPNSVTVSDRFIDSALAEPSAVRVSRGAICTATAVATVSEWRDQGLKLSHYDGHRRRNASRAASLCRTIASSSREIEVDLVLIRTQELAASLRQASSETIHDRAVALIGLGPGSTPAGDDVLAALVATLHAAVRRSETNSEQTKIIFGAVARAIEGNLQRTTPLSAELLSCACLGLVLPALQDFVNGPKLSPDPHHLLSIGQTSGYFLAWGSLLALEAVGLHTEQERYVA